MPHVILEHSQPLENKVSIAELLNLVHHTLGQQNSFDIDAVKSRAISYDHFLVTTFAQSKDFLHIQLRIMEGRRPEDIQAAVAKISENVLKILPSEVELTIEVCEMNKSLYFKKKASH